MMIIKRKIFADKWSDELARLAGHINGSVENKNKKIVDMKVATPKKRNTSGKQLEIKFPDWY